VLNDGKMLAEERGTVGRVPSWVASRSVTMRCADVNQYQQEGRARMYIGGGAVVLILVVILIVFLLRR
jgi:hypothetical protein